MLPEERQDQIAELVDQKGIVTIDDIIAATGTSVATARRDVTDLAAMGRIIRIHGGARSVNSRFLSRQEPSVAAKSLLNHEEKARIAAEAVRHIHTGDRIILDSGTTTYELALLVSSLTGVTVVTNDLRIATQLSMNQRNEVIMVGGSIRKGYFSTYGYYAETMMKGLSVDKIFLSADAVDPALGIMSFVTDDVQIKETGIRNAREVYLLCDHSKFGTQALCSLGLLDEITAIIGPAGLEPDIADAFRAAGKELILV